MLEALENRDGAAMELIARRHSHHRIEMVREALDILARRPKATAKALAEPSADR